MDGVFVTDVVVVAVAALGVAAAVVASVVRRHEPEEDWQEDVEPGEVKLRPGAGWGNGGSWH